MGVLYTFLIILFIFLSNTAFSLTFKSNGEVIASDGSIMKKSFADRYQDALTQFSNGEEIVDWPVVEFNTFGNPIKKKGFMGEKILGEGAPLFSLPKSISGDPVESIALYNGMIQENFIQVMLANSSEEWAIEKGFENEIIENAKINVKNLIDDGFQEFKLTILTKEFIKESSNFKSFEEIKGSSSYSELSSKLNKFYGVDESLSSQIIEQKFKSGIDADNFAINAKSFKNIIEERTGIQINDHGWTDNLVREELNSLSDELGKDININEEIAKINEEAGKAAMDYANSDLKQTLEEVANAAREEAVNDVAARIAAAEAYVESARAAREEAERAVAEAANEEASAAALAELERTLAEESGANDNLSNVIETEATEP
jgi:hypothetical protein